MLGSWWRYQNIQNRYFVWSEICSMFTIQTRTRQISFKMIWVMLRAFAAKTPTPTHVKIYKVCIYVIVWVSSVFPWLLEGLTAAWMLWTPSSRRSGSWMQQEKGFCCNKGLHSMEPCHLEEATGFSCVCQIVFKVSLTERFRKSV